MLSKISDFYEIKVSYLILAYKVFGALGSDTFLIDFYYYNE